MLEISNETKDLIKRWEGLKLKAYKCPAGVWTIGWGHTRTAKPGMTITREQAEKLFEEDVDYFEEGVKKLLTRPYTPHQLGAFTSLAYNIGLGDFKNSTALRRFNAGDLAGAAEAITWWNKATVNGKKVVLKGLVDRREDERQLFWKDVEADAKVVVTEEMPQKVEGGEAKPITQSKTFLSGLAGLLLSGLGAANEMVEGFPIPPKYALIAVGVITLLIMINRWHEARKGEH